MSEPLVSITEDVWGGKSTRRIDEIQIVVVSPTSMKPWLGMDDRVNIGGPNIQFR